MQSTQQETTTVAAAAALQGRRVRSGCVCKVHLMSHRLSHQPSYCMS